MGNSKKASQIRNKNDKKEQRIYQWLHRNT